MEIYGVKTICVVVIKKKARKRGDHQPTRQRERI